MVVDDNEGILQFVGDVLDMMGCAEIVRFSSAEEALAAFTAAPDEFQVVVTDLEMPGVSGVELCRRVRALSPSVKVLLVTGRAEITEVQALRWGFSRFIAKPFSAAALWRALETLGISSSQGWNFLQPEAASIAA